jgi:hypothetical protein
MVRQPPRDPHGQHSSASWPALRRRRLRATELHLRRAGRALELIPGDPEAGRLARVTFRLASRLRTDPDAPA